MMKILIVDGGVANGAAFAESLRKAGFDVVGRIQGMTDLYLHMRELAPEAVIVGADSPARDTLEGIALSARYTPKPIIMLASAASMDVVREAAVAGISFYVTPDLSPVLIRSLVETAVGQFQRASELEKKLERVHRKLEEQQLVTQVKCDLMERAGLTEDGAYRHLRRTAMERRMSLPELARAALRGDVAL